MTLPYGTIRLFQRAMCWWLLGWSLWMLLWGLPAVVAFTPSLVPDGWFAWLTHPVGMVGPGLRVYAVAILLSIAVVGCLHGLLREATVWVSMLMAWSFHSVMNAAWLNGHGGIHLIANLLLWNILLSFRDAPLRSWFAAIGFRAARLQLLVVYAATTAQKLTGMHWIDGTAVGIVATDPEFGGRWLLSVPTLPTMLSWAALLFQAAFILMVWWRPTRRIWLAAGVVFHLLSAWWIGIPEMGLAFIAAYTIWLSDKEADRMLRLTAWRSSMTRNDKTATPHPPLEAVSAPSTPDRTEVR